MFWVPKCGDIFMASVLTCGCCPYISMARDPLRSDLISWLFLSVVDSGERPAMSKDDWCQKITQKHWCCKNHEGTRIETRYARLLYPFGHEEFKKRKKTGWWFQTFFIFHNIYGMSSFPLTFIFFKMVIAPPTSLDISLSWRFHRIFRSWKKYGEQITWWRSFFIPPFFAPGSIAQFRLKSWFSGPKNGGNMLDSRWTATCLWSLELRSEQDVHPRFLGLGFFMLGLRQNLLPSGND